MLFKVDRDADFSVDEKRDEDFVEAMEEVLEGREKSTAVRMVYSSGSPRLRDDLARCLSLEPEDLYSPEGPLNLGGLYDLVNTQGFERLRGKPWPIYPSPAFSGDKPLWDRISQGDLMIHLPYHSFDPVVRFFSGGRKGPPGNLHQDGPVPDQRELPGNSRPGRGRHERQAGYRPGGT
jgi:polyphosphate kinase